MRRCTGWLVPMAARQPDGEGRDGGRRQLLHAEPVTDARTLGEVTRASATKHLASPYVRPLLEERAVDATLRLDPTRRQATQNTSVRVRPAPPLCGARFAQVTADRQGRS
jgi:hypothetical protein